MGAYKHIETCTGDYIAAHYTRAVEIGIGNNPTAAEALAAKGFLVGCTDIKSLSLPAVLHFTVDDIFSPRLTLYQNADVIYAIRPAIEMIPPLIDLARDVNCDLIVYHLGFESYGSGGEIIDCGILLHRYHTKSEHIKT
jgi:uncharacterized UPF0146 family protein